MKRALTKLEQLDDRELFETLSEGLPLIVRNAAKFEETARRLHGSPGYRDSEVMRGFAEEEAAKVLILIDYVRCPRNWKRRAEVLSRCYGHLEKQIYANMCEYPNVWTFSELSKAVERECRPLYLDGPNSVDWIFRNEILEKRERKLYVDYVQDVTDADGECFWIEPSHSKFFAINWDYAGPGCVTLIRSLNRAGGLSAAGLATIADVWRGYEPSADSDRDELRRLIVKTLKRLGTGGGSFDETDAQFMVRHWPFPMWPLDIKEWCGNSGDLAGLRQERQREMKWIEEKEAKRDPAPVISWIKVVELSEAYAAWESDVEACSARRDPKKTGGLRIRSSTEMEKNLGLQSYSLIRKMLAALSDGERVALVALGWYGREGFGADWSGIHEHAINMAPGLCENYQIGLGRHWHNGYIRWKTDPAPFSAGI